MKTLYDSEIEIMLSPTLRILERDYEQAYGEKIRIEFNSGSGETYNDMCGTIRLGGEMNQLFDYETQAFAVANFYTLAEHEIGHSKWTGRNLPEVEYNNNVDSEKHSCLNVLEDDRQEAITVQKNVMADFKKVRYYTQDRILANLDKTQLMDKTTMCLALFRTINPGRYIKFYSQIFGADKIKELIRLEKEYFNYRKDIVNNYSNAVEIFNIFTVFYDYLTELFDNYNQPPQQQQPQEKGKAGEPTEQTEDGSDDSESENTEDSENDSDNNNEDSESDLNKEQQSGVGTTRADNAELDDAEALQELEQDLAEALKQVEKQISDYENEGIHESPVKGSATEYTPRVKIRIDAENIAYKGKKNAENIGKKSVMFSSPRNLNRKKYIENKIFPQPMAKLYDTKAQRNGVSRNKKPSITFYIDLSGSMNSDNKYLYVLDYIYQFYKKMNRYMDIDIVSFSSYSFKIDSSHLNYNDFTTIMSRYGSGTYLDIESDWANKDLNIVLTDGGIGNISVLEKRFLQTAYFIILDSSGYTENYYKGLVPEKNLEVCVKVSEVGKSYEKATERIKQLLRA